jgi:hypothetical protein
VVKERAFLDAMHCSCKAHSTASTMNREDKWGGERGGEEKREVGNGAHDKGERQAPVLAIEPPRD